MKKLITLLSIMAGSAAYGSSKDLNNYATQMSRSYLNIALTSADASQNPNLICSIETYTENIVAAAAKALNIADSISNSNSTNTLKLKIATELKSSKNFQSVAARSLTYRLAVENKPGGLTRETIEKNLIGAKFYGPAMGAMGNVSSIVISSRTQAVLTESVYDEATGNITPVPRIVSISFSEPSSNDQALLEKINLPSSFLKVKIQSRDYFLIQDYKWNSEGMWILLPADSKTSESYYMDGFVEYPSECDA